MKLADSRRFYLPLWNLDKLSECQRAVPPDMPERTGGNVLIRLEVWLEQSLMRKSSMVPDERVRGEILT